jgi:hypothetical protein
MKRFISVVHIICNASNNDEAELKSRDIFKNVDSMDDDMVLCHVETKDFPQREPQLAAAI